MIRQKTLDFARLFYDSGEKEKNETVTLCSDDYGHGGTDGADDCRGG